MLRWTRSPCSLLHRPAAGTGPAKHWGVKASPTGKQVQAARGGLSRPSLAPRATPKWQPTAQS